MKRFTYKAILEFLKLLVQIKRFFVVIGRYLGQWLSRFFGKSARILLFGGYKRYVGVRRKMSSYLGNTEDKVYAISSHTVFSSILIGVLVLTLIMPHTRFWVPSAYGAGNNSVLLQVLAPGEEEASFAQDVIITETAQAAPTASAQADPFAFAVKTQPEAVGTDNDQDIDQLVGVWGDGANIAAPMILPGAEVTPSRRAITTYVVQQGDSVGTIAEKFGVSVNTLLWENNLNARSYIRPGDVLAILPVSGVSHVVKRGETLSKIAKKYSIDATSELVEFNRLANANDIVIGEKIVIPGGKKIKTVPRVTSPVYAPKSYSNIAAPPPSRYAAGEGMVWPTSGHVVTQYYHARHQALDIDGHYDSPLYASDSGVVTISGWRKGYGLGIDIDHGNGIKTRYGHASKLFVSVGDRVTKGEVIAMMGTTGYSTGTHLHFEIHVNGVKVNPFRYVR